jgi:hypothetical protein
MQCATACRVEYRKDPETNQILHNRWGYPIIDDDLLLGIDVAGGGTNRTKLVLRSPKYGIAWVAKTLDTDDLDIVADEGEKLIREWNITDWRTVVDAGGLGHGLPAIFKKPQHTGEGCALRRKRYQAQRPNHL